VIGGGAGGKKLSEILPSAAQLSSITSQLADIVTVDVKKFGAKGDGSTDDTTAFQNAINSLTDNSIFLIPKGQYSISSLTLSGKNNIKIIGYGATLFGDNNTKNMMEISNCKFIYFEGIKFTFRNQPTTYSISAGIIIKANDYKAIYVEKCIFDGIANHAIWVDNAKDNFDVTAGTTSTPIVIDKCYFLNQMTPTTSTQNYSAIFLGLDGEYATITHNEFRIVWQAIRGIGGANALVDGNTIMSCTTRFDGGTALIYFSNSSSNSAKVIIINNRINHNDKGVNAITCIGDLTRNESRYTIHGNHVLGHGISTNHRVMYIGNSVSSVVTNNYLSTFSGITDPNNQPNITLEGCTNVIVDNNTVEYGALLRLINSKVFLGKNVLEDPVAGVTNAVNMDTTSFIIPKNGTYGYRINGGGVLGVESDNINWTSVRNGTGDYTITHNLGHTSYVATAFPDNQTTPLLTAIVRTANDIRIRTFDTTGAPIDGNIMGTIKVNLVNKYNV
jgi:polygalacturonase